MCNAQFNKEHNVACSLLLVRKIRPALRASMVEGVAAVVMSLAAGDGVMVAMVLGQAAEVVVLFGFGVVVAVELGQAAEVVVLFGFGEKAFTAILLFASPPAKNNFCATSLIVIYIRANAPFSRPTITALLLNCAEGRPLVAPVTFMT